MDHAFEYKWISLDRMKLINYKRNIFDIGIYVYIALYIIDSMDQTNIFGDHVF